VSRSIEAPAELRDKLKCFLFAENIALEITIEDGADLLLRDSGGRPKCSLNTLYCGGWIDCETAREAAERLGISKQDFGKLLDFADVKIRNCALGCFQ
jgi:hypothetical protein